MKCLIQSSPKPSRARGRRRPAVLLLLAALAAGGCRQDMRDQARFEPLEASAFFPDGRIERPAVEGTIARGGLQLDGHLYRGTIDGAPAAAYPLPVTQALLERGRGRYDIFCAPCHDRAGTGRGIIVKRGFQPPTSFHIDRLREAAPGYYFDVMTRGFGAMPSYAEQVPVRDRWAIAAYIRVLQLSQHAELAALPPERQQAFHAALDAATTTTPRQSAPSGGRHNE